MREELSARVVRPSGGEKVGTRSSQEARTAQEDPKLSFQRGNRVFLALFLSWPTR